MSELPLGWADSWAERGRVIRPQAAFLRAVRSHCDLPGALLASEPDVTAAPRGRRPRAKAIRETPRSAAGMGRHHGRTFCPSAHAALCLFGTGLSMEASHGSFLHTVGTLLVGMAIGGMLWGQRP